MEENTEERLLDEIRREKPEIKFKEGLKMTAARDIKMRKRKTGKEYYFAEGSKVTLIPMHKDGRCKRIYGFGITADKEFEEFIVSMEFVRLENFEEAAELTARAIEDSCFSSVVESLSGESVEPDGHDQYGFPSILIAAGMV